LNVGKDQRGRLVTNEKDLIFAPPAELFSAEQLIYDCLEMNKIPVHVGLSACFNIILSAFQAHNVPTSLLEKYLEGFRGCIEDMGGVLTTNREGHEKQG
jgi:hypothetical protein